MKPSPDRKIQTIKPVPAYSKPIDRRKLAVILISGKTDWPNNQQLSESIKQLASNAFKGTLWQVQKVMIDEAPAKVTITRRRHA